jgi:hypothetical protein
MFSIQDEFDTWHPAQLLVQVDDNLCSKDRRRSPSSLYEPCSGKKIDLEDGVEGFAINEKQNEDLHGPLGRQLN